MEHGGKSALETVQEFLGSLAGREPRAEDVRPIRWALDELVKRITRLHAIAPSYARATLSEDVLRLVRISHGQDEGWLRIAALL